jgi:hypothetical protein
MKRPITIVKGIPRTTNDPNAQQYVFDTKPGHGRYLRPRESEDVMIAVFENGKMLNVPITDLEE